MTSHVVRLYAAAAAIVVFFLTWAGIAARPWVAPQQQDPRLAAVGTLEQRLQRDAALVQQVVNVRAELARAKASAAAPAPAPAVRVVTLPPITTTVWPSSALIGRPPRSPPAAT